VDFDKLDYLIEHYDDMPEVFLWGKTNIHKFVDDETLQSALKQNEFTPLLKQDHKTYSDKFGQVCYYQGGIYYERNDSWYFNADSVEPMHFYNFSDWAQHFMLPNPRYIPFAPGGNYILTKEKVHKYSKDLYEEMQSFLAHSRRPAEAQAAERSYYMMWI
jgi:hypothetical protein